MEEEKAQGERKVDKEGGELRTVRIPDPTPSLVNRGFRPEPALPPRGGSLSSACLSRGPCEASRGPARASAPQFLPGDAMPPSLSGPTPKRFRSMGRRGYKASFPSSPPVSCSLPCKDLQHFPGPAVVPDRGPSQPCANTSSLPPRGEPASGGTASRKQPFVEGESLAFDLSVPYLSSLASLPRRILACKTKFSHFLRATFHLQRGGHSAPSSALFPLPVPFPGIFDRSGPKLARKRCQSIMSQRCIHVIAMCLNYVFCGGKWIPSAELRRPPSSCQLAAFDRIRRFISACGSQAPLFPMCPGRRSHELVARIRGLHLFASTHGPLPGGGYGQASFGQATGSDIKRPELHPYTSLNAARLKLSGSAGFWPLPFLQPNLILPFLEPKVLRFREEEPEEPHPSRCFDSAEELAALFCKWDRQGLLGFTFENHEEWMKVRVFNARKNDLCDRQTGDRRSLVRSFATSFCGQSLFYVGP